MANPDRKCSSKHISKNLRKSNRPKIFLKRIKYSGYYPYPPTPLSTVESLCPTLLVFLWKEESLKVGSILVVLSYSQTKQSIFGVIHWKHYAWLHDSLTHHVPKMSLFMTLFYVFGIQMTKLVDCSEFIMVLPTI